MNEIESSPLPVDEFTGVGGQYILQADGKRVPAQPVPEHLEVDETPVSFDNHQE